MQSSQVAEIWRLRGRAIGDVDARRGALAITALNAGKHIILDRPIWKSLLVAREWNAKASTTPHFKDCAQFFAVIENGASCFADLSYLAPDKLGCELPQYWRVTVHETRGVAEAGHNLPHVTVVTDTDAEPRNFPALTDEPPRYLQDFLDEISGSPAAHGLITENVLDVARQTLEAQLAAKSTHP
jgi:predicted dehydrogenase